MEDETLVEDGTLAEQEEAGEEEVEEEEEEEAGEVDYKSKAEKAEELAENYRKRAEKAEKKAKAPKKESTSSLTTSDILALAKADIDDEDMDEVLEYAAYKGISVKEALNSSIVKTTISEKAEERKSANAVNTGATRRGSSQVSDDRLLADARKGVMPDSEGDIARLALLKFKNK